MVKNINTLEARQDFVKFFNKHKDRFLECMTTQSSPYHIELCFSSDEDGYAKFYIHNHYVKIVKDDYTFNINFYGTEIDSESKDSYDDILQALSDEVVRREDVEQAKAEAELKRLLNTQWCL